MRKFGLPLFWKFVIAITFIVALFGGINAYFIWSDTQRVLEKESEKRALFIAQSLARQLTVPLLYEDYVAAQKLLDETKVVGKSVVYIFIITEINNVLLNTFDDFFPKTLIAANRFDSKKKFTIVLLKDKNNKNDIIRDIAIPIFNGELGILRVGISEKSIFDDVRQTVMNFWLMVGFFLIFGITGAFLFAHFITSPIKLIQAVTDKIRFDTIADASVPIIRIRERKFSGIKFYFRASDEIDKLIDNFNEMIYRLQTTFAELEQTQKRLIESEKMAAIGTMASGIAHEINNPISGIQNAIRRIQKNPENIEQNENYLRMMYNASERIENVVKGLLSFSRREELEPREFNLLELLEKIELLLSYKIDNTGIEFFVKITEDKKNIFASPNHIQQVIINLLINSIDAIEEKGSEGGKIILSVDEDDDFSTITIEDTGCGIPANEIKKIFDPFFTTKAAHKGTGLGLAVTSQIIDSHNGRIYVESIENVGTKFKIKIPLKKRDLTNA